MMVRNKKVALLILAISTSPNIYAFGFQDLDSFFDDQIQYMEQMRDSMRKTEQAFKTAFSSNNIASLQITDNEENVVIEIEGIKADSFNASISDNKDVLTISTPTDTIKVSIDELSPNREFISVELAQDIREEKTDKKDTKDKNDDEKKRVQIFQSSTRMNSGRIIEGTINLDEALKNPVHVITYNKATDTVTITLPKIKTKKSEQSIPVTIVEEKEIEVEK